MFELHGKIDRQQLAAWKTTLVPVEPIWKIKPFELSIGGENLQ